MALGGSVPASRECSKWKRGARTLSSDAPKGYMTPPPNLGAAALAEGGRKNSRQILKVILRWVS